MAKSVEKERIFRELAKKTPYEIWVESEEIPVIKTFFVEDVQNIPLEWWERKGGFGAFLNMEGTGGVNDCYVCKIPAGKSLKPQRHLFEESIYVVSGRGAASVWQENGKKVTFEWQAGSLFSPPLNAWYQLFNGSGTEPAYYLAVTTAPTMINLLHNTDFIFNNPFAFTDRFNGGENYFSNNGNHFEKDYYGYEFVGHLWETNFIPDLRAFELWDYKERGAGGKSTKFALSENTTACHMSEFAVGTYKKSHRHGPGAHVIILAGQGYSLIWSDGEPIKRYDWHEGSMIVPPDRWWHQHFNTGRERARYLALRPFQSYRYRGLSKPYKGRIDRRLGGDQIEYDDEDPIVRKMFEEEMAKAGLESHMTFKP